MARRDWMQERDFCLGAAADFVMRWGGGCDEIIVAKRKQRKFARESRELVTMARALEHEGWRFLAIPDRPGGFFWHDQYGSVNNMGGGFPTWEEAVKRTFDSAIRTLITSERASAQV